MLRDSERQTVIFLPKYMCEGDCVLDAFLPFQTFESKEQLGIAFSHRRQLEKIPCDDQLRGTHVKSAHRTRIRSRRACMPPNGRSVFFRRLWAIDERVLNKCPSTMETTSGLLQHRQAGIWNRGAHPRR